MRRVVGLALGATMSTGCASACSAVTSTAVAMQLEGAAERVAAARGGEPVVPPVEVVDGATMVRRWRDELEADPEAREALERWACTVAATGVAQGPEQVSDALAHTLSLGVGAMYDPDTRAVLVSPVLPIGSPMFERVLVHEASHAWQHERFGDQDGAFSSEGSSDTNHVARLLIEGDAELTTTLVLLPELAMQTAHPAGSRWPPSDAAEPLSRYLEDTLGQAYAEGYAAVQQRYVDRGQRGVNDWLAEPPLSSEQVLDPARQDDLPRYVALDVIDVLDGSWTAHAADTEGQFGLARLLGAGRPDAPPDVVVTGWDGDRVQCLEGPRGPAVVWRTVWDSPEDAQQLAEYLADWPLAELTVEVRGDEALVLAGWTDEERPEVARAAWRGSWQEIPERAALAPFQP